MTAATQGMNAEVTARFQSELLASMGEQIGRLGWDADRIAEHQRDQLRRLIKDAQRQSPFHARRLADVDAEHLDLQDLASLPVMTKSEMMANFDDVTTDRRVTRAAVDAHLAATSVTPQWLDGEYMCIASGGSSGTRGMFVMSREATLAFSVAGLRPGIARGPAAGGPPPGGLAVGLVAAPAAVHATRLVSALIDGSFARIVSAPSTLPLREIVTRLNEGQPHTIVGYPSMLCQLAEERAAGRLTMSPFAISSTSEHLSREASTAIQEAFGVPVTNMFGSSEGLVGVSQPGEDAIEFASDQVIVELVDEQYRPVAKGAPSHSVLITNLYNLAQPLIRYELNDSFIEHPPAPNHGHFRASVQGRQDEVFVYGDVRVHPLVIRSVLVKTPEVSEYQVRQTPRGVELDIVTSRPCDEGALAAHIAHALAEAGLVEPEVAVRNVPSVSRHSETGKTRRFIPL